MIYICVLDYYQKSEKYYEGETIVHACKKALEDRDCIVTGDHITPSGTMKLGGDKYTIYKSSHTEAFWRAQLSENMGANEDFGWGDNEDEALEHVSRCFRKTEED